MYQVKVERLIDKPIEEVFDQIVDHANYTRFPGVKHAELIEEGKQNKNGVGALRFIDAGKMRLQERIIAYERPFKMAYHIESSEPFFIDLEKGEVTLTQEGEKTKVVWISRGKIKVPLIGPLMDKLFENSFGKAFGAILKHIARG